MKKLMTMIAAVATAFGLYADPTSIFKSSFETAEEIPTQGGWTCEDNSATFTKTAGDAGANVYDTGNARYGFFTGDNENYLTLKTPLNVPVNHDISGATVTEDDSVYFDQLMQFTAADEALDVTDTDAKIALFVQDLSEAVAPDTPKAETNLYAVAYKYENGTPGKHIYNLGPIDITKWHRVTVKAIKAQGTYAGFEVFIDGEARAHGGDVAYDATMVSSLTKAAQAMNAANKILPALADSLVIASIGFAGQGAIDDVAASFDSPGEWANDKNFTLVWDANSHLTALKYTAYGEEITVDLAAGSAVIPWTADMTVTVNPTFDTNWALDEYAGEGFNAVGNVLTINSDTATATIVAKDATPRITMNGKDYANFAQVIKEITYPAELTINQTVEVGKTDAGKTDALFNGDVTIDLNGQTIKGIANGPKYVIDCKGNLTIVDKSESKAGKIEIDTEKTTAYQGVVGVYAPSAADVLLTVSAGKFDGAVYLAPADEDYGKADSLITGGSFLKGEEAAFPLTLATGFKAEEKEGYWVVSEKAKATVAITEGNFTVSGVEDGDEVYVGATITFTVAANTGYTLGDVTVNAGVVTPKETVYSYTVQDADETVTIEAATTVNTYTIRYTDGFETYQTDSYTVENYNEKELWDGARTGYTFDDDGWTDVETGATVTDLAAYLKDKADDIELTGTWEEIEYKVTVTVKDNVGGNASANPATYTINVTPEIWLTATAAANYKFKKWTLKKGAATISDLESYETTLNIVAGTIGDIEIEAEFEADAPVDPVDGKLEPGGEANLQALKDALPQGTDINAWATAVYGTDGKIPADKLNASSEELVKAAAAYNLKVMASPVEVAVAATDAANTFKFTLTDADGDDPIVAQKTLIQNLVKYTTALGATTPFTQSNENAVGVEFVDGGFTAELTGKDATGAAANAGFMKVDLSVAE